MNYLFLLCLGFLLAPESLEAQPNSPEKFSFNTGTNGFVENIGQVRDQYGTTNKNVAFLFSETSFHLALNRDGFSIEFLRVNYDKSNRYESSLSLDDESESKAIVTTSRVDVELKGMNPHTAIEGTAFSESVVNCYQNVLPGPGFTGARVFHEVTYRNVYEHIDFVFSYTKNKELRYEFILHPGADPNNIRLVFKGASQLFLNEDKEVEMFTSLGFARQTAPVTYRVSDGSIIPSSFQLKNHTLSFNLNKQDIKNTTVIIDPTLIWGTFFGGEEEDMAAEVGICTDGKVAMTGHTISTTFIASIGAYQTFYAGGFNDLFLALFKSNGKIEWSTYFGGPGEDVCYGVAIDTASDPNAIILCGNTISDTMVTTDSAHQTAIGGHGDILITKFSGSGALEWSTYMGGQWQEHARQAVCDQAGNIYFTGTTKSEQGITTPGTYESTYQGGEGDAYLAKFSPGGARIWSTYIGGNGDDRCHAIGLDPNSHIVVHGTTESDSGLVSLGAYQTVYGGNIDGMLAKFNNNGFFFWCTYFGGEAEDHGRGVTTDTLGAIYFCGYTFSETGISTPSAFQEQWAPGYNSGNDPLYDGYLAKFLSTGQSVWSTYYGYSENDIANAVVIDNNQMLYLIGKTRSDTIIATAEGFQPLLSGGQDGMFVKFDGSGNRIWGSYLGGPLDDAINNGRLGPDGRLYFALDTDGYLPVTPDVHQTTINGSGEVAVFVFDLEEACFDTYEPNETKITAMELSAYQDTMLYGYSGSIHNDTDTDWFMVKLPNTNLKITLTELSNDYDLNFYNKNNQLLFSSFNSGTQDEVIIFNLTPQDTFYIEIAHAPGEYNANDCYRLRVMTKSTPWILYTGTPAWIDESVFSLFFSPNPVSDLLTVECTTPDPGSSQIILYDILGREVYSAPASFSESERLINIPVNQLENGVYILRLQYKDYIAQNKVIIQHD